MAEDVWSPDADPWVARAEARFSDALSNALYRVHVEAHRALGLPDVAADLVRDAYRALSLPVAKAEGGGYSRAAAAFEALKATPRGARRARDLARGLAEAWWERGLLEDEARRAIVVAHVLGRLRAGAAVEAPGGASFRAWAARIADADDGRALEWAQERACEHVTRLRDATRGALASAVLSAMEAGESPQRLAVTLTSVFGTLNRDARRLAITEVAAARASGYLAGVPVGEDVEWFAAPDACERCRALHGRRFRVRRDPGDGEREVWPGKSNVGRAHARMTRAGRERAEEERAWPTIPLHPHCRCRWVRAALAPSPDVSPRLLAMLEAVSAAELA